MYAYDTGVKARVKPAISRAAATYSQRVNRASMRFTQSCPRLLSRSTRVRPIRSERRPRIGVMKNVTRLMSDVTRVWPCSVMPTSFMSFG